MRGNDQIDRLAADPLLSAGIETADRDVEDMDRIYATKLAMIRQAVRSLIGRLMSWFAV